MDLYADLPDDTDDFGSEPTTKNKKQSSTTINEPQEIEPEQESFDTTLEKIQTRDQILRYHVSFAKYLGAYQSKIEQMDDLELPELKRLLQEISITVSARTSGNMARRNFNALINGLECAAPILNMNLRGLSQIIEADNEVAECIEELNIKYDVMKYTPPEVRLFLLTSNLVIAVNRENKKLQKVVEILAEPVPQDHINKFNDL
jgi:hypothetical protein